MQLILAQIYIFNRYNHVDVITCTLQNNKTIPLVATSLDTMKVVHSSRVKVNNDFWDMLQMLRTRI